MPKLPIGGGREAQPAGTTGLWSWGQAMGSGLGSGQWDLNDQARARGRRGQTLWGLQSVTSASRQGYPGMAGARGTRGERGPPGTVGPTVSPLHTWTTQQTVGGGGHTYMQTQRPAPTHV